MVTPDDAAELAHALGKVLGNPELRRAMHFAARRHAAGMTWDATAAQVETALISAMARSRSAVLNRGPA
jgi:glycosyltransferase involved in cell wall biosynthesis